MKSVFTYGISWCPSGVVNVPLPRPAPPKPPLADRVQRLHELVALAVLAQREPAGRRAEHLRRRPRVEPDRDPLVDVRDLPVGRVAADGEEHEAGERRTRAARSRCRASRGRSRSRGAPSRGRSSRRGRASPRPRSGAAGRGPSAGPARAPRASRAGTRRGRRSAKIFASSPGWNSSGPTCTQSRAPFTVVADPGQPRQEEQHDRADAEEVLVLLEHAVVAAQPDQRGGEERDADHDPEPLPERVGRVEAVDLGQPDRGQQRRPSAAGTGRRSAPSRRATTCAAR